MELICLFCPAFITLLIMLPHYQKEKKYDILKIICLYFIHVLAINGIILLITKNFFNINEYVFTVVFSMKYLLLGITLSFIIPFIEINNKKLLSESYYNELWKKTKIKLGVLKKFIKNHKELLFSLIFVISIFILDLFLRYIEYKNIGFYGVLELSPNILTLGYIFLITTIGLIIPKVLSNIWYIITYIITLLLFCIDYFLINIKGEPFTINQIGVAAEGVEFINFVIEKINLEFIIILLTSIILFIFSIWVNQKIVRKKFKIMSTIKLIFIIVIFMLINFIGVKKLGTYEEGVFFNQVLLPRFNLENIVDSNKTLSVAGIYEYHYRDIKYYIESNLEKMEKSEINKLIKERQISYQENEYTGIFKDKNLIMIMLESVDYTAVNNESMPTLSKLMKKGWTFTNRYSQFANGSGNTIATEYTSMTGLFYEDSLYNINRNDYSLSLANMFKNNGYRTTSIHENEGIFYNRNILHKSFGFDDSIFLLDENPKIERYIDTNLVSNNVIDRIIFSEEKFMTYMITISAHGPYTNNYLCHSDEEAASDEKACLEYGHKKTDDMLKELLEKLEKSGMMDDTVLVLYSDHHAYSYNYTEDELEEYPEVDYNKDIKNIPFVIYSNDIKRKEFKDIYMSDIDIVPTLLNLFGIKYEPQYYIGADVFASYHPNMIIFNNYGWYDGNQYSLNLGVDTTTSEYINNSTYVKKLLDLNKILINNNYYKYFKQEKDE